MANVVTVRIPDDLAQRLEPLKGNINISEVCRSALEAKAQTHERIQTALSEGDVMIGLVQRLKIQKAEANDRSYAQGQEDGQTWAIREASYQELGSWGAGTHHYRDPKNEYEWNISHTYFDGDGPLYEIPFPEGPTAQAHLKSTRTAAEDENQVFEILSYHTGFKDAVREIWNQVKGELAE